MTREDSTVKTTGDDFLSRLAWRSSTPAEVTPRLGLRYAAMPDLPDEAALRWRLEWRLEAPSDQNDQGGKDR